MLTLLAKITSLLALDMGEMMLIFVAAGGAIGAIVGIVVYFVGKKGQAKKANQQPIAEQQETLAPEQEITEANDQGQLVMPRNVIYSVGLNGQIRVGKYELTSADESIFKFNVRFNGLVKEYANGDVLTLTDGDTISPVSGSVVLTPVED